MRILIVVAHPDDESYGMGGTAALLARNHELTLHVVTEGTSAQYPSDPAPLILAKQEHTRRAASILGIKGVTFGAFPDMQLDTCGCLDLSRHLGKVFQAVRPDIVFTHHAGDLNSDHRAVREGVLICARPVSGIIAPDVYGFEVRSSTEWGDGRPFVPRLYVDIDETFHAKIRAIECYSTEVRPFPHPRSAEAVRALAMVRGSESGCRLAEGFEVIREVRHVSVDRGWWCTR